MPLTRNLYEIDEVVSALQICLCKGWPRALFWLWELVVSEEETLANQTLIDSWLHYGGGIDPAILTISAENWVERCVRISAAIRTAGSMNALRFLNATTTMPVRPSVTPLAKNPMVAARRRQSSAQFVASLDSAEQVSPADAANFWISFDSACRQGSRTDAIWLLQAAQTILSADAIWSALRIACRGSATTVVTQLQGAASPHPLQQLLFQAAATLHLCIPTQERLSYAVPIWTVHQRDWSLWLSQVGRRRARLYTIPVEALHAKTTRGQIPFKYTNIDDIRDPVPLLLEGCTFWKTTLRSYNITLDATSGASVFPDDDTIESFFDTMFPDDIPDEWSKEDQMKSHGRGVQETAVAPPVELQIREEPVDRRAWNCGIHVRAKKS
jgi:hypothetical protein